ncbi:zonular occludens toxin domain-containing protein [Uliginosibacterium sp. H3]|uniref:Zonular occludens toxin domain-containing protein n=1 Tax=Uliginosibacterium silvisoli TaxID=3114758 RepID=A0ABU6K494_9RHOO|nr:zonular occludens toxin domain-containing protein [Uliginosibacterium sp. H3]
MATFAVEGKMGSGKTTFAVTVALDDYLGKGRRVASNIDLLPENYFSPFTDESRCRLTRLPDVLTVSSLDGLGFGNETIDESRNGLILLDESITILNSRTYQDKNRNDLIAWFVHARKLGWDLMFVIQAVGALDKQVRDMVVEYRVACRRMDRLKMPLVGWLGLRLPLPRVHYATTHYGLHNGAPVADFRMYRGNDVFTAFNTRQLLRSSSVDGHLDVDWKMVDRSPGLHSVLPPFHVKGRHMNKKAMWIAAGKRSAVAGFLVGALLSVGGWKTWEKLSHPKTAEIQVAAADIEWSNGSFVSMDGGAVVLIDDKGIRHVSQVARSDSRGVAVLVDGKWFGVRRNH